MNKIELTKEQIGQIAGAVLFGGLFIYLYLFYFWLPTGKTIEENTAKAESMQRDIDKARKMKARCNDLAGELERLKTEKDAAIKKLPSEKKIPDLIRTLTHLSRKYRVSVVSINPSGQSKVEYFTKVTYLIRVSGNYHDIGRFLTALGLEERILTSENLGMTPTSTEPSANGTFTLAAYQYNG
jgi:type IV pilus assembly protein PilO